MDMYATDCVLVESFQLTPLERSGADEPGALYRQADGLVLFDHKHVRPRFCGVFCGH
jgi:hypothetical protein